MKELMVWAEGKSNGETSDTGCGTGDRASLRMQEIMDVSPPTPHPPYPSSRHLTRNVAGRDCTRCVGTRPTRKRVRRGRRAATGQTFWMQ
eukprot:424887-Rhodomonas_salina.1